MKIFQKSCMGPGSKKYFLETVVSLVVLTVAASLASLTFGAVDIPIQEVISVLFGHGEELQRQIIFLARLPRLFGCLLAGTALATSGVIIQGVLSNPLAAPNIIGVNAGAGLAVALCSTFVPALGLATLLVLLISERAGASRITLILAGVAMSSIFSAGIDAVLTFFPDALNGYSDFRIGGVKNLSMSRLAPAFWIILFTLLVALSLSNELDLLMLGGESAQSLGLPAKQMRLLLLAVAAALAGAAVSIVGLLGFVGLLVPHIMRRLVGEESFPLLLSSALGGAALLTICDLVSRLLFAPFELPLGIVLSLMGGPFFLWLLFRQKRRPHL